MRTLSVTIGAVAALAAAATLWVENGDLPATTTGADATATATATATAIQETAVSGAIVRHGLLRRTCSATALRLVTAIGSSLATL